jgi:hypothetical protein
MALSRLRSSANPPQREFARGEARNRAVLLYPVLIA